MNKKIVFLLCSILFILPPMTAAAAKGGHGNENSGKGPQPNQAAYQHANENAKFKRLNDENAVKNQEIEENAKRLEKEKAKAKKEAERAKKKAEKEAERAKKKAQQKLKEKKK